MWLIKKNVFGHAKVRKRSFCSDICCSENLIADQKNKLT